VGVHGCRTTRLSGREHGPPGRRTLRRPRVPFPSASEALASGDRACKGCQPDQGRGPWQPGKGDGTVGYIRQSVTYLYDTGGTEAATDSRRYNEGSVH
jgi:methylphosphotriester-DNA--protein-cysteine methyltransferase